MSFDLMLASFATVVHNSLCILMFIEINVLMTSVSK